MFSFYECEEVVAAKELLHRELTNLKNTLRNRSFTRSQTIANSNFETSRNNTPYPLI